jgi:hypothetical protein
MSLSSRRTVAGAARLALVILAIVIVAGYVKRHVHTPSIGRIRTQAPPPDAPLAPGDMRIYNTDSSVDLLLVGNNILAGLSPKTVARVKNALDSSAERDTTGLGGSISQLVKKSVAGAIGTHAVFPLSEIRDVRYEGNQIVFEWKNGKSHQLFGSANVNGSKVSNSFRPDDAERFVGAVRARLGLTPAAP